MASQVAGMPLSVISIGVAYGGNMEVGVVYNPFNDELFVARRGQGSVSPFSLSAKFNTMTSRIICWVLLNSSKNSHAHDLLSPLLLSLLRICFSIFLYFWTERCMCLMLQGHIWMALHLGSCLLTRNWRTQLLQ